MTEAGAKNVGRLFHNTAVEAETTEVMIPELVFAFCGKIAKDPELGPVYTEILDEDWSAHLETVCALWLAMLIRGSRGRRYKRRHWVPLHVPQKVNVGQQRVFFHGQHNVGAVRLAGQVFSQVSGPEFNKNGWQ